MNEPIPLRGPGSGRPPEDWREQLRPRERRPIRDPDLPHQIVIGQRFVSCNCRHVGGTRLDGQYYDPICPLGPAEQILAAYYDPAVHHWETR